MSRSATEINSQLSHSGLNIRDDQKSLASFGDIGAVIPNLVAGNIWSDHITNSLNTNYYFKINSADGYPSVAYALNAVIGRGRHFVGDKIMVFTIYGTHYENIVLGGFS